jgi:hypothetical protein
MLLFILIIVCCFSAVGRAVRASEESKSPDVPRCLWVLGAALFTHVVTFVSVSYFDQNIVIWYLLLAMISGTTGAFCLETRPGNNAMPESQTDPVSVRPALTAH